MDFVETPTRYQKPEADDAPSYPAQGYLPRIVGISMLRAKLVLYMSEERTLSH